MKKIHPEQSRKIDYKKDFKEFYLPSAKEPSIIKVPKWNFLMVDGKGAPNDKEYQNAIGALYGVTFTIKFALKFKKIGPEYTVAPLESLWYTANSEPFDLKNKSNWLWTAMIVQPNHITKKHVDEAIKQTIEKENKKGKEHNPAVNEIKLVPFDEGLCVQTMRIGPYSKEGPTIEKMHKLAKARGYKLYSKHHEIYLGDPRRTKPSKLKTVLRHPVKK